MDKSKEQLRWTVEKSNAIIRQSRYSLSVQQQKILLYMISQIRPADTVNTEYVFSIQDFCEIAGLSTAGFYYASIKNDLKNLRDSSTWIRIGKTDILLAWLNTVVIDEETSEIRVKFHESVQPYLFELREHYTSYQLTEVLGMSSKYAIRLYELLKSFAFGDAFHAAQEIEKCYSVQELKTLLDAESYKQYGHIKTRVLQPAIQEINKCSEEIHVDMIEKKTGRAVTHIVFMISTAHARQMLDAKKRKQTTLGMPPHAPY